MVIGRVLIAGHASESGAAQSANGTTWFFHHFYSEGIRGEIAWNCEGTEHSATLAQDGDAIEFTYYGAASIAQILAQLTDNAGKV